MYYNYCMPKELYLSELKELRKKLRSNPTNAEKELWKSIRNMQLGFKFRRQVSIGYFVVDFYCKDLALAIELDGPVHNKKIIKERDILRQEIIESSGVIFLRFTNKDIFENLDWVLNKIKKKCQQLRENNIKTSLLVENQQNHS